MIPEIKLLENQIAKYAGIESVIHVECNNISSEGYLPKDWNKPYFSVALTFILNKLLDKFDALANLKITIIPIDEFLETSTPKEKAIQAVFDLRNAFINEYLNN